MTLQRMHHGMHAPWDYRHPTHEAIKKGRPITAEEGQWLLDEINRLRKIEMEVRAYMHHVEQKRFYGERLFDMLKPEEAKREPVTPER